MDELRRLAGRVRAGDANAAQELGRRLEGPLGRIVRRALASPPGASAVSRRIQAEAICSDEPAWPNTDSAIRVRGIADRLCDSLIDGLARRSVAAGETMRI
jgi:hypothetical protein